MIKSAIISTGSSLPELIVTNKDLSKIMDTSDEWIKSRTGISERRISINKDTSDFAYEAAKNAMDKASLKAEDIDLIIVATVTPDMHMPSTACLVQKKLGAVNATAFDISAACTGFIYALSVADSMIKSGSPKIALVVGAEVLSKAVNWQDRGTAVLFGDGAAAVILKEASDDYGILGIYTKSRGEDGDVLTMGNEKVKNPYVNENTNAISKYIEMNGRAVFKFAVEVMPDSILSVLEKSNEKLENIDFIVPHQANERIISYVSKKLNVDYEKFYVNLNRIGNTSSASIPIALDEMNRKGLLKKGSKIILVGFGGGLTYGATLIKWNN